eukprot:TRINITY_DN4502_c0_g1_i1.p1 TRINITY_DN4502_c0_g1~~TRINITY_DN4502_c0_g1_i1.p1  ORF type:complete len:1110 (+),score=317.42 TRINITY_DN4502_c0_g1_i1:80-3409(+)
MPAAGTEENKIKETTTIIMGTDGTNISSSGGVAKDDKDVKKEDEKIGRFSYKVKNFTKISKEKKRYYTDWFEILNHKWRLLIFPHGNNGVDDLSIYLDAEVKPNSAPRCARFTIEIVNQIQSAESIRREALHKFQAEETDWGFTHFMRLAQLYDPRSGFIKDDRIEINIEVESLKEIPPGGLSGYHYYNYDSKKETGFVGLKNQGATCYMNSLLQALFHIPSFRKSVYTLPTDKEIPTQSVQLALQRIFYSLQFGSTGVGTKELTQSFGWTAIDSFTQHDVQELNRVLMDNLETKMKGTKAEGTVEKLFQGKITNFIKCMNIDFESNREEAFFDLSLNVKGCKDIYASFDTYTEVEILDGTNKYHAEGHGLQAAKKGCTFSQIPPVLHLQLKRFEYDPYKDAMVKVNDKYEFPQVLDLTKYMDTEVDTKTDPPIYNLHGVLVHSGDVHGGHYYAFIRPSVKPNWFKFDDDRVTVATDAQAIDDNFGGEEEYCYISQGRKMTTTHKKFSNAYMLVYLRASRVTDILADIPETEIPSHLKERFNQELIDQESKRKEKEEAHLFMTLKIATDKDLAKHHKSDLIRWDAVQCLKVRKTSSLKDIRKDVIAPSLGVPFERQRFWTWVSRQNKTTRPDTLITAIEEDLPIENVAKKMPDLKLYMEISPLPPSPSTSNSVSDSSSQTSSITSSALSSSSCFAPIHDDDVLIFFKYYDPFSETLTYVGHQMVKASMKITNMTGMMCAMARIPPSSHLLVFEEVKPTMIDPIKPQYTLREGEISNGDIIVYQTQVDVSNSANINLPTAVDYYDHILNRILVKFRRLDQPKKTAFVLDLNKKMLFDQVTAKVAARVGTDPGKIRLTGHNTNHDQPKTSSFRRAERLSLNDMLSLYYQPATDILFYEALDVPVSEIENKRLMKIAYHNSNTTLQEQLQFLLPRDALVRDVISTVKDMVKGEGDFRLLEIWNYKIHKIPNPTDGINVLNDYAQQRVEAISPEELSMSDGHFRVPMVHFYRDFTTVQSYGVPFYFVIEEGETGKQVKSRVSMKLALPEEDVLKWKLAIVSFGIPEYIGDNDVVLKKPLETNEYIGLEHQDHLPPRHHGVRPHHVEKPIKIYN